MSNLTHRAPPRMMALAAACALALVLADPAAAAPMSGQVGHGGIELERLDRGLVAAATSEGVFLSWRLLGSEVSGHSATGMTGADFRVYRDGTRIATVTDSTNYLDRAGTAGASYRVAAVVGGRELPRSAPATPWAGGSYDLPLRRPADGVTPTGEAYTYSANDM